MQPRRVRRPVDGILLLDKPLGLSSNHALQRARGMLQAAKAGHTGTLDPMATGLLPLAFGEATKFSGLLLDADKAYEATVRLGVETDTGDADGVALREREVQVTAEQVAAVLAGFVGDIVQLPPMYSALKRDGKPLYEYARAGIEVEREGRKVQIHGIDLQSVNLPEFRIRVHCSKGTYIRTLAMDIGEQLGCGAHLSALRRVAIGRFDVAAAISLDAFDALDLAGRDAVLLPVDAMVADYPVLQLDAQEALHVCQGRRIRPAAAGVADTYRLYDPDDRFLGLADLGGEDGVLVPRRLVSTQTT